MERCPICRARLGGSPICPRCGADLTLAAAARRQGESALRAAVAALAAGNRDEARRRLEQAGALHHQPLAARLAQWLAGGRGGE